MNSLIREIRDRDFFDRKKSIKSVKNYDKEVRYSSINDLTKK